MMSRWLPIAGLTLIVACTSSPSVPPPPPPCAAHDPATPTPTPGPFTLVRLDPSAPAPFQLAVQACVGLRNRAASGSVYVDADAHDAVWLTELDLVPTTTVDAAGFLASCVTDFPACVRYDYASQQAL
jgi:hypothetical protein